MLVSSVSDSPHLPTFAPTKGDSKGPRPFVPSWRLELRSNSWGWSRRGPVKRAPPWRVFPPFLRAKEKGCPRGMSTKAEIISFLHTYIKFLHSPQNRRSSGECLMLKNIPPGRFSVPKHCLTNSKLQKTLCSCGTPGHPRRGCPTSKPSPGRF